MYRKPKFVEPAERTNQPILRFIFLTVIKKFLQVFSVPIEDHIIN